MSVHASVSQVNAPNGDWVQVVPENRERKLLMIQALPDPVYGPMEVRLSFGGKNGGQVYNLNGQFAPAIAPTNEIWAYVFKSEETVPEIYIQVIEG